MGIAEGFGNNYNEGMKIINNGNICKYIPKNDQVPNGWELRKLL
jgi:hypothetical protein